MIWAAVLIGIFLLPFFSPEVFKTGSLILYLALSVSLLFFSVRAKKYLKDRLILSPLLVLLIIIIITSFLSSHPRLALGNGLYFVFYIMVFIVISDLDSKKKRQIALVLMGASFFISVQALLQRFLYFDKLIPYITSHKASFTGKELSYILDIAARRRVLSMFNTPNLLASYLVMVNLIILGYLFTNRMRKLNFLLLSLLIINSCSLWFTSSFSGLAGLIFGIFLFFVLMFTKDREGFKAASRLLVPLAISISVLFVILFIRRFFYSGGAYSLSFALQGRLQFWKTALRAIADRPLSFAGLGNFGYLYPIYACSKDVESKMVHNLFLQLWIEIGPYGLLAFMAFAGLLLFSGIKDILTAKAVSDKEVLQISSICAVFAFLFHNMAGFSFFVPQTAIIWWILCALSIDSRHG